MIITLNTTIGYFCHSCSNMTVRHIHAFQFSGHQDQLFYCDYENSLEPCIDIKEENSKYTLKILCPICEIEHIFHMTYADFWSKGTKSLICPQTEVEIFFIGKSDIISKISESHERVLDTLYEDMDESEDEISSEILTVIYTLYANKKLFCQCGNKTLNITINTNTVTIQCHNCGCNIELPFNETTLNMLINANALIIDK